MGKECEAIVVGASLVDLPLYPIPDDILNRMSYSVEKMEITIGGDAINEATVIERLGHHTRLVSYLGKDAFGQQVLDHCKRNSIDIDFIKIDPTATTAINIGLVRQDGERIYISNRSGTTWKFKMSDIDIQAIATARVLSFASIFNSPLFDNDALMCLFKQAKEQSMIICADIKDPRFGETLSDISGALSYVDYFFPNFEEACKLTGKQEIDDIADVILGYGVKTAVIKQGKNGCYIKTCKGEKLSIPSYHPAKRVDTTGAGDCFASGFICALLEDKSLRECGEFANVVASLAIEQIGATTGIVSREQVDKRNRDYIALERLSNGNG